MNWRVYAEELLEFRAKVFSFPIEEVTKEIVSEFKKEFFILKKDFSRVAWDAEAHVDNYYQEIGLIIDKLEKLFRYEELFYGDTVDDVLSSPERLGRELTMEDLIEDNITNQNPQIF
jgi:hypothetical protein